MRHGNFVRALPNDILILWPHFMKQNWQKKKLAIPSSIAICDIGCSNQNAIKGLL